MNETHVTIVGTLIADPTVLVTDDGLCITKFRIASNTRKFDRNRGRFVDADTMFIDVACFRALAENAAESLHKGVHVVVYGRFRIREWKGENDRTFIRPQIDAWAIGPDLKYGTCAYRRRPRTEQVEPQPGRSEADELAARLDRTVAARLSRDSDTQTIPGPEDDGYDDDGYDALALARAELAADLVAEFNGDSGGGDPAAGLNLELAQETALSAAR